MPYYQDFYIIGHVIQVILSYMNIRERRTIFIFFKSMHRLTEHNILQRRMILLHISHLPKIHRYIYIYIYTRGLYKKYLWSAKIHLFILTSETLIPFKVVSLIMHTLLPAVLPLLETFLESFLWNLVQLGRRVLHNVFS